MSAAPGTDKAVRREKIVMALGIAAIILFSANLLTMVARHIWPDFRFESLIAADCGPDAFQVEAIREASDDHAVHVFVNRWKHDNGTQKFVVRLNGSDLQADDLEAFTDAADRIESDLRAEMDRLRLDIARQQHRIETDMTAHHDARLRTLNQARVRALREVRETVDASGNRASTIRRP